jgi:hypothetical protein
MAAREAAREQWRAKRRANRYALLGKAWNPKSGLATGFTEGNQPRESVRKD